jgi:TetR/AcrR family transcriptional regulator, transcriptional repressor for nem operon
MGRRPAYERSTVVAAAAELFWEQGYEPTSIGDLEARTGLDRSSLYHAFGTKHALFEVALRCYLEMFQNGLGALRRDDAALAAIVGFFTGMAQALRADPVRNARGCLMVNVVAELGARDADVARLGAAYRDCLREAFATALSHAAARGEVDAGRTHPRANLLAAQVMGLFLTARIDPADAAEVCEGVAAEVSSWRLGSTRPPA